jgi:hypothetical protein
MSGPFLSLSFTSKMGAYCENRLLFVREYVATQSFLLVLAFESNYLLVGRCKIPDCPGFSGRFKEIVTSRHYSLGFRHLNSNYIPYPEPTKLSVQLQ